jgi:hypothetical protein
VRKESCDHDVVYSGQTNLEQKFAYICRRCGECGWDTRYVMAQVNFDEYCRQRVTHGWASPNPLGAPGGAWRRDEQARIAEMRDAVRRHWRFPLVANAVAFVVTSIGCLWGGPPPLWAVATLPVFATLVCVSWWRMQRG